MPTKYPTTLKDLQDCYSLGAFQRGRKCIENASSTIHLNCYGVKVTNLGYDGPICCCVPLRDPNKTKNLYDKKGELRKNEHQDRIPNKILEVFEKTMSTLPIPTPANFELLYDFVSANCGLSNGNCLLVYDFCLRYGYNIGIQPEEYVYLFQGAKAGAQAYFGCPIKVFRIKTISFRPEFPSKFESSDIENFLCVCCDHIKYIRDNHPSFLPVPTKIIY